MGKINLQNECIKRKYFEWLKEAEGLADSSIDKVVRSILLWEEFTNNLDFKNFDREQAKSYKKWLADRKNPATGQPISLMTRHSYLLGLNSFFTWLSGQPGYKSRISFHDIAYLKLDKKETKIALNPTHRRYPTIEIIKKAVTSINLKTEVDRRDQAIIAFTLLSGMRDEAIITLPMGCVDINKLQVHQDPDRGVKTKFSKDIPTTLFVFDQDLLGIFKNWIIYLREEKFFTDFDPVFPATKKEQESGDSCCFIGENIEKAFWKSTGSIRNIFKKRFTNAGLEYYSPHSIRHLATKLATELCKTPADFKAVSQNLGHENVATTMFDYARLPDEEVNKKIKGLNSGADDSLQEKTIKELLKNYEIRLKK